LGVAWVLPMTVTETAFAQGLNKALC